MEEKVIKLEDSKYILQSIEKILYLFIKRLFDIFVSLIGCLFLLPLSVIIKVCYMLQKDYNPILFTQERIGKDGNTFKFYKFRSMVPNADEILFKLLKENKDLEQEYKKNKKLKDDPRITKLGKFLRKSSLDELPQLINVLKGDMSMIGNRPYLPREKGDMTLYFDNIVKTKPGLTGYWQVNGRSNLNFIKRMELESFYSDNQSLKLDIIIFFKTIKVVFDGKDAK